MQADIRTEVARIIRVLQRRNAEWTGATRSGPAQRGVDRRNAEWTGATRRLLPTTNHFAPSLIVNYAFRFSQLAFFNVY